MIIDKEKSKSEVIEILEHGFRILKANNLKCFPFTQYFAKQIGANTFGVLAYQLKVNPNLKESDFVLIFEGKEYRK